MIGIPKDFCRLIGIDGVSLRRGDRVLDALHQFVELDTFERFGRNVAVFDEPTTCKCRFRSQDLVQWPRNQVAQRPADCKRDIRKSHVNRLFVFRRRHANVFAKFRRADDFANCKDEYRKASDATRHRHPRKDKPDDRNDHAQDERCHHAITRKESRKRQDEDDNRRRIDIDDHLWLERSIGFQERLDKAHSPPRRLERRSIHPHRGRQKRFTNSAPIGPFIEEIRQQIPQLHEHEPETRHDEQKEQHRLVFEKRLHRLDENSAHRFFFALCRLFC